MAKSMSSSRDRIDEGRYIRALELISSAQYDERIEKYHTTEDSCECADFQKGTKLCKHIIAVRIKTGKIKGRSLEEMRTDDARSLYASVVVKSIRIGWVNGLINSIPILGESVIKSMMWAQLYEDVFPAFDELEEIGKEIEQLDFEAYCMRQTHHGVPKETQHIFYNYQETREEDYPFKVVYSRVKQIYSKAVVSPRVAWIAGIWLDMGGGAGGLKRTIDDHPFKGVPTACYDMHVKMNGIRGRQTILSGTFEQHLEISKVVLSRGWDYLRELVHNSGVILGTEVKAEKFEPKQLTFLQ